MDAKTTQKVINGMADKINDLSELTNIHDERIHCITEGVTSENVITCRVQNDLYNKIKSLNKDMTMYINKHINNLNDKIDENEQEEAKKIDAKLFWAIDERIDRVVEQFEEKIKAMAKNNMSQALECRIGELEDKIDDLETFKKTSEQVISKLNNKIKVMESETMETEALFMDRLDSLENKYKYMFNNKDIKHLMNKIDDLEAKNYQIKGELDGIYKVLELTDDQIEGLIEYNNNKKAEDDFNKVMGEAHETLKRVKNNKMESK